MRSIECDGLSPRPLENGEAELTEGQTVEPGEGDEEDAILVEDEKPEEAKKGRVGLNEDDSPVDTFGGGFV